MARKKRKKNTKKVCKKSFEYLNDPESKIYKDSLKRNRKIINKKLKITKIRTLTSNIKVIGTFKEIINHIKRPAVELVRSFFSYNRFTNCQHCHRSKLSNDVKQLERAHCNRPNCDRVSLLKHSTEKYYKDKNTPVLLKHIYKHFIKLHGKIPMYYLCTKCHRTYDKN